MTTVAIVAQGAMGDRGRARADQSWRAGFDLLARGALAGRAPERAAAAGMIAVSDAELMVADMLLSIVPPGDALAFAERMAPHLTATARKPLFVDCNAVSPVTVGKIAEVVAPTGADFVDAGIIGMPPKPGAAGPSFYASGWQRRRRFCALTDFGLDARRLDAPIGAASALKMSYAGYSRARPPLARR